MIEIVPSIISPDLKFTKERLGKVLGLVKKVQLDIVDGKYADNRTWPFDDGQYEEMRRMADGEEKFPYIDELVLQVDMMILHPIEYLSDFISLGVKSFVVHLDSTDHVKECIDTIKGAGCEIGLAIKPSGNEIVLEEYLLQIDFVQFMGNDKIGHSGIDFDKGVLKKIKDFHKRHPSIPLQIDIGVSEETIPALKDAGVTSFVSGSSLFTAPDTKERILKLQNF